MKHFSLVFRTTQFLGQLDLFIFMRATLLSIKLTYLNLFWFESPGVCNVISNIHRKPFTHTLIPLCFSGILEASVTNVQIAYIAYKDNFHSTIRVTCLLKLVGVFN